MLSSSVALFWRLVPHPHVDAPVLSHQRGLTCAVAEQCRLCRRIAFN